ncbi:MAG: M48 family metallopeptidase, partial [Verrucomicrobiae bacterium]|nr:M48 family metallopeptidase [Verrucomicrobiae bacterium]
PSALYIHLAETLQDSYRLGASHFRRNRLAAIVAYGRRESEWNGILQRVGQRIASVAQKDLPTARWEFVLFESKEVNAFCLPGGKVGVFTGILPIAKDENGLAAIVGHEVAHAAARHGAERMSEALLIEVGGAVLDTATQRKAEATRKALAVAYGLGTQLGVYLPHSRKQELEADHMGLIYMARAGYDPRTAVELWRRFAAYGKQRGSAVPGFLRTHPVDEVRIAQLQQLMPKALAEYRPAQAATTPVSEPVRR